MVRSNVASLSGAVELVAVGLSKLSLEAFPEHGVPEPLILVKALLSGVLGVEELVGVLHVAIVAGSELATLLAPLLVYLQECRVLTEVKEAVTVSIRCCKVSEDFFKALHGCNGIGGEPLVELLVLLLVFLAQSQPEVVVLLGKCHERLLIIGNRLLDRSRLVCDFDHFESSWFA